MTKLNENGGIARGLLIVIVLLMVFSYFSSRNNSESRNSDTGYDRIGPSPERLAMLKTSLLDFSWSTGGFGSVMEASFTIENGNDFEVKDIEVICTMMGNSGTEIGTARHTIYDIVGPRKKKAFKDVNMGFINSQSSSSKCRISKVSI